MLQYIGFNWVKAINNARSEAEMHRVVQQRAVVETVTTAATGTGDIASVGPTLAQTVAGVWRSACHWLKDVLVDLGLLAVQKLANTPVPDLPQIAKTAVVTKCVSLIKQRVTPRFIQAITPYAVKLAVVVSGVIGANPALVCMLRRLA